MAQRHVAEAERHICQQEMTITRLMLAGLPIANAATCLTLFNRTLELHRAHCNCIAHDLEQRGRLREDSGKTA
jgi:hypothetical protein